jgi:hypothetical protein
MRSDACWSGPIPEFRRLWSEDNAVASIAFSLPETVVVTGTASGLGREIAVLLLECGTQVIGVDLASSAQRERSFCSNHGLGQ